MKSITLLTYILLSLKCFGQSDDLEYKERPFQVLFSINCRDGKGTEIRNFDRPNINETITIEKNGTLTIIHASGLPLEFNKDTVISLRQIHEVLFPPTPKKRGKKEPEKILLRPKLEHLLVTDSKELLSKSGLCLDCGNGIQIICPYVSSYGGWFYSNMNKNFYVKWQDFNSNEFSVKITSIFEEEFYSRVVTQNELTIDSAQFNKFLRKEGILMISINDLKSDRHSGRILVKLNPFHQLKTDIDCGTHSPSIALLTGFSCELQGNKLRKEAEKYFIRATELSDNKFFKDMLDNYYKRGQK